jgi:hypothetical protein
VKDEVGLLLEWKEKGVVGKVITAWRDYENMVITKVTPQRTPTTGDAVEVTIELRSVRIVEISLTTLPIPTEPRGKSMLNKGKQPSIPLLDGPKKSVAQELAEKFGLRRSSR